MGNYPKIGECSKILESSNNRGSITLGAAWPRCPKCRKSWVQGDWVHPWLAVRVTRRLDLEWTWGPIEQKVATCDDEEASVLFLVSFDAQKPLDPPLIPVNTERDRNLLRAAPHDRIRARTGSGVLCRTLYAWQDLEPYSNIFLSPGCLPWVECVSSCSPPWTAITAASYLSLLPLQCPAGGRHIISKQELNEWTNESLEVRAVMWPEADALIARLQFPALLNVIMFSAFFESSPVPRLKIWSGSCLPALSEMLIWEEMA